METQSQSEVDDCTVPELKEDRAPAVVPDGGANKNSDSVQAKDQDSGKERRKKRRLKHEPQSIFGEYIN